MQQKIVTKSDAEILVDLQDIQPDISAFAWDGGVPSITADTLVSLRVMNYFKLMDYLKAVEV